MRGCASPCSIALSTVPMSRYTMRMRWWELRVYFSVRLPTSIRWMNKRSSSGVSSSMAVYCFRLLNERVHVGGGGFQLFQPGLLFGDLFLQRFLFDGVIARQHPVLLIGHPPQHIVLIEPLEQLGQFLSASPHGIQIFLDRVHLTPQLQRILAAYVGGELLFLHPREVRHPA